MKHHDSNIIKLKRIENCRVCGSHYQQLYKAHRLCRQCYHGIKAGNATMIALKHQRAVKSCL